MKPHFRWALITPLMAALLAACEQAPSTAQQHQEPAPDGTAMLQTPKAIASEHGELHETLERAATEGGEIAAAARELEAVLSPHFKREGEIATPPLGLLPLLAQGAPTAEMRSVLPLTKALEQELPQMLREHEAIRAAVTKFRAAAERTGREDYVRFADNLAAHAREEEEILYPAAILVGRHVERTAPPQ